MKRLFALALCGLLSLPLSGCGTTGGNSGSQSGSSSQDNSQEQVQTPVDIPFALAIYPAYSLHPVLAENRANLTLAPLLYESLFVVDNTFEPTPALCQSYSSSEDKLSWSFVVRSGVTFSDGTALDGPQVASALNLARQPDSRYAQRLKDVSAITGDGMTVIITLARPNASLPAQLDIPIALGQGERPVGTGAYELTGQGDSLSLTARSGWWQDKTLPRQEIALFAVNQTDDLISAFAAGDIAMVDVDLMGTNALGYSGSYETWDYPTTDFLYLGFNTQSGLCKDASVRQALSRAIDRDSIVQTDYASHAAAAALPVHPNSARYDQMLAQQLSFHPEQLVEQLEQQRVLGKSLTFLVNSENTAKISVAQRIAYQLEAAGMHVTLKTLAFEEYTTALSAGTYDLYLGEVVLTADFDLSALLSPTGPLNYGQWRDDTIDTLLGAVRQAQGDSQLSAAKSLFAYLNQQAPIAPICFKNGSVLTQWGQLSNLEPVRGNVFYRLEGWIIR